MPHNYILDTDHVTFFQREYPIVLQRMAEVNNDVIVTTIITYEEQIKGRFSFIKRATSSKKLVDGYTDLQNSINYFNTLPILPFDETAYAYYLALRKQKIRIGTQDLRIAAITLANNSTLVTRNWRDFSKVPNLTLVDWSI